jgi:uncharacterized protein with PQ loop repeat
MMQQVGFIAAIVLPFWNIPLIVRLEQRKSSKDISLSWVLGVFICLLLMLPSALVSPDPIFKVFGLLNVALFSGVVVQVVRYR